MKAKNEDDPPQKKKKKKKKKKKTRKKKRRAGNVNKLGIRDLTPCLFLVSF